MSSKNFDSANALIEELRESRIPVSAFAAALWSRVGREMGPEELDWARGICSDLGPSSLLSVLEGMNALENGVLSANGVHRLVGILLQMEEPKSSLLGGTPVLWTLPAGCPTVVADSQSLLVTTRILLDSAEESVVICAPFIEQRGMGLLMSSLRSALSRGVSLSILTHDIMDTGSDASGAIEPLRREALNVSGHLLLYCAKFPSEVSRHHHPLLHAKVLIVDGAKAIIGSANLTSYAYESNFECGVLLSGAPIHEVSQTLDSMLNSPLVNCVVNTK